MIATVILRCYERNAIEELYLVKLLRFNDSNVGLWKGMKADWALAIRQALPMNLDEYKELQQNELFLITMADRQASIVSTSLEI